MSNTETLQDLILNEVRKEHTPITLFLMNGFQMKGIITGFDAFVVVLSSEGKQQMIYKHAISTLVPLQPVRFQVS
ncbi:MAG: RNA chaperone Hfq [Oscillospiraceae bacterium]|nr:RNA chaperone Hfq [Oscillospiraceae bacterium]